jgi:hypothetical protein
LKFIHLLTQIGYLHESVVSPVTNVLTVVDGFTVEPLVPLIPGAVVLIKGGKHVTFKTVPDSVRK